MAQAIAFDAVDIVRADVSWKPGVTGTLKIAHLAEAHGLRCEIHCTTMGFMDMANLHVSCAIKNCEYFELLVPEEPFRFPMKDKYPIDKNGIAHVPQKPGIGVELDWDAIDNTCVEHKITKAKVKPRCFQIQPQDNVATMMDDAVAGSIEVIGATRQEIVASEKIERGHKIALRDIAPNEAVIKFGVRIGHATKPISRGAWVHSAQSRQRSR